MQILNSVFYSGLLITVTEYIIIIQHLGKSQVHFICQPLKSCNYQHPLMVDQGFSVQLNKYQVICFSSTSKKATTIFWKMSPTKAKKTTTKKYILAGVECSTSPFQSVAKREQKLANSLSPVTSVAVVGVTSLHCFVLCNARASICSVQLS